MSISENESSVESFSKNSIFAHLQSSTLSDALPGDSQLEKKKKQKTELAL